MEGPMLSDEELIQRLNVPPLNSFVAQLAEHARTRGTRG